MQYYNSYYELLHEPVTKAKVAVDAVIFESSRIIWELKQPHWMTARTVQTKCFAFWNIFVLSHKQTTVKFLSLKELKNFFINSGLEELMQM